MYGGIYGCFCFIMQIKKKVLTLWITIDRKYYSQETKTYKREAWMNKSERPLSGKARGNNPHNWKIRDPRDWCNLLMTPFLWKLLFKKLIFRKIYNKVAWKRNFNNFWLNINNFFTFFYYFSGHDVVFHLFGVIPCMTKPYETDFFSSSMTMNIYQQLSIQRSNTMKCRKRNFRK